MHLSRKIPKSQKSSRACRPWSPLRLSTWPLAEVKHHGLLHDAMAVVQTCPCSCASVSLTALQGHFHVLKRADAEGLDGGLRSSHTCTRQSTRSQANRVYCTIEDVARSVKRGTHDTMYDMLVASHFRCYYGDHSHAFVEDRLVAR
jgi:hypothetical protein